MSSRIRFVGLLSAILALVNVSSVAAQFTSGSLVIQRAGDGVAALTNGSTPSFLDTFSTSGSSLSNMGLPNAATRPTASPFNITMSGSATSEGLLARSANGLFLTVSGYNGIAGDTGIAGSSSNSGTVILRTVGVINGAGTIDSSRGLNFSSGNNARGAVSSDGTNFYTIGGGGVNYYGSSTSGTGTQFTNRTTRQAAIFNNTLFVTSGSNGAPYASGNGIYLVGTAGTLPTAAAPTFTKIIDTGAATPRTYAFQFNTAFTVAYATDDQTTSAGGIKKYTQSGGVWTLAYTFGTGAANIGARGLTVDWSNPNAPIIYGTSAETSNNALFTVTDTGSGSTVTRIATAGTNRAFRGVEQALLPSVWTSSTGGNFSSTTTTDYGAGSTSTPFDNWSTNLVDGTNLAFQKVNAASLTLNNNSSLTNVASIGFSGAGFGSSDTAYTITGTGLTLNGVDVIGSGVTGSGVTNNSTVAQTVNIPLTLGANQIFAANNGALNFGGSPLSLGSASNGYILTVGGAQNTSISSVLQDGGSAAGLLTKIGAGTLTLSSANTYTGNTGIGGGTLLLSSSGSVNSSPVISVGSGATLDVQTQTGTFTVGGSVTQTLQGLGNVVGGTVIGATGTIRGDTGTGTGPLTTGNLTVNAGGAIAANLGASGTSSILATTAGSTVNLQPTSKLNLTSVIAFDRSAPASWNIATLDNAANLTGHDVNGTFGTFVSSGGSSGTPTGNVIIGLNGGNFSSLISGDTLTLQKSGTNLVLNFAPVPEPGTILAVSAGVLGLGAFLRKKLAKKA